MTRRHRRPAMTASGGLAGCWLIAALLLFSGAILSPTFGQESAQTSRTAVEEGGETIRAGVHVSPPFVMRSDDGFSGMAIELWNELAERRGVETEFVEYPTVRELVAAVGTGEVDVAVTNLTITERRAETIDFTHPWFDAGLQIMISEAPRTGFSNLLDGLVDSGHMRIFAWIAGIIMVSTVLLTLFDRRFDPNFPARWRDGVAESFYTVMSVAVSGKPPSRARLFGWIGRLWSALWLVCGIAVLAYVTSSVTTVMTTLALTDRINGLSDLPGKPIGVLEGGTGEEFAVAAGLSATPYANIDLAVEAVVNGEVAAIVADAPVLDYYAHTRPQHDVTVVGEIFEPEKYGFGIKQHSAFRRPLTVALLGAEHGGYIEELRTQYFGARQ